MIPKHLADALRRKAKANPGRGKTANRPTLSSICASGADVSCILRRTKVALTVNEATRSLAG
jgi:hypothetical protein